VSHALSRRLPASIHLLDRHVGTLCRIRRILTAIEATLGSEAGHALLAAATK